MGLHRLSLLALSIVVGGISCTSGDSPRSVPEQEEPATHQTAAPPENAPAIQLLDATVEGQFFRSKRLPETRLEVDASLPQLGARRFSLLEGRTDVELAFFAELDSSRVRRFCEIQTEAYRDTAEGRFRRTAVDTARVGNDLYYVGYFCFDLAEQGRARPDTDIAALLALIENQGALVEGIYVGLRLARPLDSANRSEIMILYGESVLVNGIDCNDEAGAAEKLAALRERGLRSFVAHSTRGQ